MKATAKKKVPVRKCLGCNESFPKKELIRVVRTPEGKIELDFIGKKSGRGAYICKKVSCFKKARKSKKFEKNFECDIPDEIFTELEVELIKNE